MRRPFGILLALLVALATWAGGWTATGTVGHWTGPATASAQSGNAEPLDEDRYAQWEKDATRAEEALENGRASDAAFEDLRLQLVDWRTQFLAGQFRDDGRIKTLEEQIAALGAPPAEGETESKELAARRAILQEEYQQLITPARQAEEAHARANGLILRIDRLIRSRQKDQFLSRGPSPLVPGNIMGAADDLQMVSRILIAEVSSAANLKTDRANFRNNLPQIILLVALSLLLLLRGRLWFKRAAVWTLRHGSGSDRSQVAAMLVSLGQVILPMIGLMALTAALLSSSMFGPSGEGVIETFPAMGFAFFAARWLGGQTFPRLNNWPVTMELSGRERVRGRFYSSSLGILFATALLIQSVAQLFPLKPETLAFLAFPVIVLGALCLAGLARLMISHGQHDPDSDPSSLSISDAVDERSFVDRSILLIGRACMIFAIAGPVLSVVGYGRAAIFMSLSPSLTLGILATVSFLQRLSMATFRLFSDPSRDPSKGLLPVLINFALMVGALPSIAIVWGVRDADLDELWTNLQEGVVVGETRVSPMILLAFIAAFAAGMLVTRLVQTAMRASILPRTGIDPGGQKAMISGLGYLGVFLSAMVAVSVAGLDLSNLAIVAGALSVGVGFGLQNVVSNFVSGLILLIERPVTEGDWIEVGGVMGTVRKISVRATTVETFDRTDVIVPNSDLVSNQVTNWTRGNLSGRLILNVGVAYGTDTRKVAGILQEIAEAHPLVIVNPPPLIVFQGFGADSLDFEMRVILRDINFGLGTRTELNHQIAERFAEEGIEIPFAQRDIWLRNPEALRPGRGSTPAQAVTAMPPRPDSVPEFPTEDD